MEKLKHPVGLKVLFFTEMWERFGFYTMLAIFTLYLDEHFHHPRPGTIYGAFLALVYFTPIAGGFVADRVLGFRKTIILGGLLLALGYGLLSVPLKETPQIEEQITKAEQEQKDNFKKWEQKVLELKKEGKTSEEAAPKYSGPERKKGRWIFFLGLLMIVCGNGLFKPNISVMVGNLYEEGNPLKDSAFNIFYMGINIGALFAPMAASFLRNNFGWPFAFAAAAVGMVVSVLIFQTFKRHIEHAEIAHHKDSMVKNVNLTKEEEKKRIFALLVIYAIVILFWMSFHQNGFTLTFWGIDCTKPFMGYKIPAELFQSINPFFVITVTPIVVLLFKFLRERKLEPSTPGKMMIGMLLTATSFAIMTLAGLSGGDTGLVSVWWLVSAYAVITFGELCLSPMGLSFCSKVAPPRFRGLMMGGWFGATAIGNYLSGAIEPLWDKLPHSKFFFFLVVSSLFAALLLRIVLKWVNEAAKAGSENAS
ncbi:MAG: peptide MFS transporter [Acidobacteria bacterium]|nr:peptide MFS transporter [Acidobacteriota bacterium]